MKEIIALIVSLLLGCPMAHAGDPLTENPNRILAGFKSAPTGVTVDVVNLATGATVADDVAATQISVDGEDSIFWEYDLSTVTGYPTDCSFLTYLVVFSPDGKDCSETGDPAGCASHVATVGGSGCNYADTCEDSIPVYPTAIVPSRGITQRVINAGKPSYITIKVACDRDFANPDYTYYWVFEYDSAGRTSRRYASPTVPSP